MKIIIILLIIYLFLIIPKINYCNNNILIISGTHGDEISPIIYFNNIKNNVVNLINPVNKLGYLLKTRNGILQPDINRQYTQNSIYPINYFITKYMQNIKNKYNNCVIFDFHEAKDYNYLNKNSLGQTIYVNPHLIKYLQQYRNPTDSLTLSVFYELINILNYNIKYDYLKYKLIYELPKESNTLDEYCNKNDFCYCLIEISNKLDLDIRLKHIDIIYNFITTLNG